MLRVLEILVCLVVGNSHAAEAVRIGDGSNRVSPIEVGQTISDLWTPLGETPPRALRASHETAWSLMDRIDFRDDLPLWESLLDRLRGRLARTVESNQLTSSGMANEAVYSEQLYLFARILRNNGFGELTILQGRVSDEVFLGETFAGNLAALPRSRKLVALFPESVRYAEKTAPWVCRTVTACRFVMNQLPTLVHRVHPESLLKVLRAIEADKASVCHGRADLRELLLKSIADLEACTKTLE